MIDVNELEQTARKLNRKLRTAPSEEQPDIAMALSYLMDAVAKATYLSTGMCHACGANQYGHEADDGMVS